MCIRDREWPSRQNEYRGVVVGQYQYQYPFYEPNVLHLKLNHTNMRPIVNGLYQSYYRMVSAAMKAYAWDRGQHWKVHVAQMAQGLSLIHIFADDLLVCFLLYGKTGDGGTGRAQQKIE